MHNIKLVAYIYFLSFCFVLQYILKRVKTCNIFILKNQTPLT